MKLSKDIAVALQILLESKGSLTSQELVQHLGISKTQAYDRLALCRYYLQERSIPFFGPKRKGILQIDAQAQNQLEQLLHNIPSNDRDFSAGDRRQYLFFELFRIPNLKNHQICQSLDISRNTCISDIAALSEELQQAGFAVKVCSSVNGYSLQGSEADLRKALVWELSRVANWTHLGDIYPLKSRIGYAFYGLPYDRLYSIAEKFARGAGNMHILLSEQSCFHIAAVIYLWTQRWHMGNFLHDADVDSSLTSLHGKQSLYWLLQDAGMELLGKILREDPSVSPASRASILQAETEELIRAIISISSIFEEYPEVLFFASSELENSAAQLIPAFERMGGNTFPRRTLVEKNVRQYLLGALCRVAFGYCFYRAEDSLIRRDYRYLLEQIRHTVSEFPALAQGLSDSEMVGLTLHYIGWMSAGEGRLDEPSPDAPRIGIVCANAVGISGLLQTQIHQFFPEAVTKLIPLSRLNTKQEETDILISTLALDISHAYLRVNALLTPYDRYRIQKQIIQHQGHSGQTAELLQDIQQITQDFVAEEQIPLLKARLEQLFINKKIKIIKEQSAMLTDLITPNRIRCVESVADWKDAIRTASIPLLEDGSILHSYVDAMIESVETIGPYIVLAPGIALPHARPEAGVVKLGMSVLRTQVPVYFDETRYANLFFVLASEDGQSHMSALIQLSRIFGNDGVFETFMDASGPAELWQMLNRQS